MRLLRASSWAAVLVLVVFAVATYAGLPDRIPAKIGFDGTVTRYSTRSLLNWFLLPGIALITHLLIQGIGKMLPSRPHWFNFPDKERFLVLPSEYQAPVIVEMRAMLDLTSLGTGLLMLVIQYHLWRTALGEQTSGAMLAIAIVPVLLTPAILIWLTRVTAALERAEERWKSAGAPAR